MVIHVMSPWMIEATFFDVASCWLQAILKSYIYPIGYGILPYFWYDLVDFYWKCRYKYTTHGSIGYLQVPFTTFSHYPRFEQ